MGRRLSHGRGGAFAAPKRQIANDGLDGSVGPSAVTLTFGAAALATGVFSVGFQMIESASTLVRTRGIIHLQLQAAGSAITAVTGAIGMIVVSAEAFAAGIASLSTPLDDTERAWYVYVPFAMESVGSGTQGADSPGRFLTIPFDSRGQRKLKVSDTLVTVIEATQDSTTTGTVLQAGIMWRSQFKL